MSTSRLWTPMAVAWLVYALLILALWIFFWDRIWWWRLVVAAFVPLEAVGVLYNPTDGQGRSLGDTLSAMMSHVVGWAGEGSRWWQSWKILPVGFVTLIALTAARAFSYGVEDPWGWMVAVVVGATIWLWNLYHWLNPGKHG